MKKLLVLLALCMVLSVVLVACNDEPVDPTDGTTDVTTEAPGTDAPTEGTTETPTTEAPTTEEPTTEAPTTEAPTTEEPTTEEPVPDPDPVITHLSFDELDKWIDISGDITNSANSLGSIFTPGQSAGWDKIANVDDYTIAYLRVWGWVGFFAEEVGEFGYQIDDQEPVFSADFAVVAGQDVVNAAAGTGAKCASRMTIMIPVRDLSGEHTIKALVKDAAGTIEELTVFTLNKAVDPDAPTFMIDVNTIASIAPGSPDVADVALSEDGSYVTLTNGTVGDPYITFRQINANARYVAVKYRTNASGSAFNFFAASTGNDATGAGDMLAPLSYEADGMWHVAVVDTDPAEAVNEECALSFVRYDFYTDGQNRSIDVAYIAGFNSVEAAEAYFANSMVIADTTNTFVSNVDANEVGTAMGDTDLAGFFNMGLPLAGSGVEDLNGAKVYHMTSINEMFANVDGAYYVYTDIVGATDPAAVFVRGYHVVNSDAVIEAFDPAAGIYKINNYYETDGNPGKCGGAGLYFNIKNDTLQILAKVYNAENTTRVGNAILEIPCTGTGLTIADDGYTVYVIVDGILYATIDLIGAQSYADINEVSPAGQFAAKAVVKTATEEYVLENTLIAAAPSQVGVVARSGGLKFTTIEVGGFTQTIIPEFPSEEEIETIFYDGTNGMITLPAGGAVKFFFRGAAGYNLSIGNAFALAVTADNLMGTTAILQADMLGTINQEVPADWFQFELLIENVSEEEVFVMIGLEEPAPEAQVLTVGENVVTAIVTKDGWNDASILSFTAEEAGTYTFTMTTDYAIGSLYYYDAPVYGMCEENTVTLTLEAGQTIELGASADVVLSDIVGATEDLVYSLGITVTKGAAEPETPVVEPLVVDLNNEANSAYYNTEWSAAGISTPFHKLGYNNFLACGTLDLSQYSKVEIVYSFDGTVGITDARVDAALSNAIGLKSEASAYGWYNNEPNFSGDLAHTDYVFHNGGWTAFRTAEIDISAVDYNGEVWLSIYNPEGTEIVIHSLTLIP